MSAFDLHRAIAQTLTHDLSTASGYRALLVYLMDLLDWADFQIIEQAAAYSQTDSTNLIGLRGPYGRGGLLLTSTVRPKVAAAPSCWTKTEDNPWNSTIRDGALYGHGATGGLTDLLAKIHAASRIDRSEYKRPLILAGLFGANAHIGGMMQLLDSGVCAPEMAMVGAGTNLEIAQSHPGETDVRIELSEVRRAAACGNASYLVTYTGPFETHSMSAAERIDCTLATIRRWRSDHVFSVHDLHARPDERPTFVLSTDEEALPQHPHFELTSSAPPVGPALDAVLSGFIEVRDKLSQLIRWYRPPWSRIGTTPSLFTGIRPVQDGLEFGLAHWPLPGENTEALIQDIRAEVQRLVPAHLVSRVDVARSVLSFDSHDRHRLKRTCVRGLKRLEVPAVIGHYALPTEAWILPAYQVDTVVFGPGDQPRQHGRGNEHVPLVHIERAGDLYEYVIRRICCR